MKKHYRHETDCLNCGAQLQGKFCYNCGQENLEIKESFGHMMNHAISDYFHFDQQFFGTLKPLLLSPGKLTNEYMAGRRVRYLHPVKMYIFISIVYFLLVFQKQDHIVSLGDSAGKTEVIAPKTIGKNNQHSALVPVKKTTDGRFNLVDSLNAVRDSIKKNKAKNHGLIVLTTDVKDTTYQAYLLTQSKLPLAKRDNALDRFLTRKSFDWKKKGDTGMESLQEGIQHSVPKMMFVQLPLFALIMSVAFRKNRKYYVEHLIYSFHLHCFIIIFLSLIMLIKLIPGVEHYLGNYLSVIAFFFITWYFYKSLRVVYNRSRFRTITKGIGTAMMYFLVIILALTIVAFITAVTMT